MPSARAVSRENLGLLLGFVGMVLFAGTLPATRLAVPHLDPWFLTVARAAIAGLAAIAILAATRRRWPLRAHWGELVIASAALVYGFPLFTALAMQTAPAAHGGVVLGVLPLATALTAALVAGERPSLGFWIAGAVAAALVTAFALRHGGGGLVVGDFWLLAAIASAAVGYTYAGKLSSQMPGWEVIAWALVPSLPIALAATVATWPANAAATAPIAWAGLLYVAFISQLIGFFFWNAGLAIGGIARVSQMQSLQPFVIVLMAATVNGENADLTTLLFAAAVVVAVMIGRRTRVAR
jgi:drug/metabolite transporter (DMT)-like permease